MDNKTDQMITVETVVNAPVAKAWEAWTKPESITQWSFASPDWHTPSATNDLRVGGKFASRMEAKDGSMGFDFGGEYDDIREHELISYFMEDGRRVIVSFREEGGSTRVTESFDAETTNLVDMQRMGWQAILDNYKAYVERD